MKCLKCNNEITVDDICQSIRGGYLQVDIDCPVCNTAYWNKLGITDFTSDLDLEDEQD
jgi:uncharacterized protein (DUF2225 family)